MPTLVLLTRAALLVRSHGKVRIGSTPWPDFKAKLCAPAEEA